MSSYSYQDQLAIVGKVRIDDGQTKRINCPFCGGRNTFTITRKGKEYVWNCYKAQCGVSGNRGGDHSINSIRDRLSNRHGDSDLIAIPVLTPIETHPQIIKWLDTNHSLAAYNNGLINIKYAPSEDRIMFPVSNGIGYSGRAREGVKPKWRKYGDTSPLLTVGQGNTAVVVEDACSACAVGILSSYSGCALLGTILTYDHIATLRSFDKVIVCLDPDAALKGQTMASRIGGNVTTRLIPDDLKRFNPDEIERILI